MSRRRQLRPIAKGEDLWNLFLFYAILGSKDSRHVRARVAWPPDRCPEPNEFWKSQLFQWVGSSGDEKPRVVTAYQMQVKAMARAGPAGPEGRSG